MRFVTFLALIAIIAPSASAAAQERGTRAVAGTVVDSITGRALSEAEAFFGPGSNNAESGMDGRFSVVASDDDTILIVRRIGYVPGRVRVPASESATLLDIGTVRLRPVATRLDRIEVEAVEVTRHPELADFYRRKNTLPGHFVTPEELERVRKATDALRLVPSVEIICSNRQFGCQAMGRRATGLFERKCAMAIYIDGIRHEDMDLDDVPAETIAGMEVYSGASTTPTYFGNSRCGTIVIWTRRG